MSVLLWKVIIFLKINIRTINIRRYYILISYSSVELRHLEKISI